MGARFAGAPTGAARNVYYFIKYLIYRIFSFSALSAGVHLLVLTPRRTGEEWKRLHAITGVIRSALDPARLLSFRFAEERGLGQGEKDDLLTR